MDRAYLDFARLYRLHQPGSFFVLRSKSNTVFRRLYSHCVERSTGVTCTKCFMRSFEHRSKRFHSHEPVLSHIHQHYAWYGQSLSLWLVWFSLLYIDNRSLPRRTTSGMKSPGLVFVLLQSAPIGLVHFNGFLQRFSLSDKCFPNPVKHEQSRWLTDSQIPVQLHTQYTFQIRGI